MASQGPQDRLLEHPLGHKRKSLFSEDLASWGHLGLYNRPEATPISSQDALGSQNPARLLPGLDFDRLLIDYDICFFFPIDV